VSPEVPETQHALVEQVQVPAGNDVVTFRYRPAHLLLEVLLSLGAAFVLLALMGVSLVRRRHHRHVEDDPMRLPRVTEQPMLHRHCCHCCHC
jgi:hypothetical protein